MKNGRISNFSRTEFFQVMTRRRKARQSDMGRAGVKSYMNRAQPFSHAYFSISAGNLNFCNFAASEIRSISPLGFSFSRPRKRQLAHPEGGIISISNIIANGQNYDSGEGHFWVGVDEFRTEILLEGRTVVRSCSSLWEG